MLCLSSNFDNLTTEFVTALFSDFTIRYSTRLRVIWQCICMDKIIISGARTHNLRNINLDIPRDKLIVITGLSGSGKSSLAFDTLYAEGQRRYVESLSAYARQFLSMMEKPDVDHIEGLSPAISIEQKATSHNPRSTVGTVTEIYDYLRLLYARVGEPQCPVHQTTLEAKAVSQMVDQLLSFPEATKIMVLAPIVRGRKGEHLQIFEQLRLQGFVRVRVNSEIYDLDDLPTLSLRKKHDIDVIVDRLKIRPDIQLRLAESIETAINLAEGLVTISFPDGEQSDLTFSSKMSCAECGYSLPELEPRLFSFNNPSGACPKCDGLGVQQFFDPTLIIPNPDISLANGAIRGWDKRNAYYYGLLQSLATHYKFDLEKPFAKLPKNVRDMVLFGSKSESIAFQYVNTRGEVTIKRHPFEGIVNNFSRRYHETE